MVIEDANKLLIFGRVAFMVTVSPAYDTEQNMDAIRPILKSDAQYLSSFLNICFISF